MVTYPEDIAEGLELTSGPHTVAAAEITSFCMVSGDHNPLHTDDAFARSVGYRERIAHGLLILSIASGLPSDDDDWAINAYLEETRRSAPPCTRATRSTCCGATRPPSCSSTSAACRPTGASATRARASTA